MLNQITVMGRIVRDPELRHTQSGTPVCSFSIACERDFKDANGNKPVDFLDIVAWRQTASFVSEYMTKGRMAVINGRLQLRDWTDRDGNKRRRAEIVANNVHFGDSRPKQTSSVPNPAPVGTYSDRSGVGSLDASGELPF